MTSILSSNAGGMVYKLLAVVMKTPQTDRMELPSNDPGKHSSVQDPVLQGVLQKDRPRNQMTVYQSHQEQTPDSLSPLT